MNHLPRSVFVLILSWGLAAAADPSENALKTAGRWVQSGNSPGGVCAVVGRADADLALAVAKQGTFIVQCLHVDSAAVDALRRSIRAAGMYGAVSASRHSGAALPYADNLVNLLVVDSYPALAQKGLTTDEALRVLAPLGRCCLGGWTAAERASVDVLVAKLRTQTDNVTVVDDGRLWIEFRKRWPAEIDEWPHFLHGPDCNPVARDRVVGPPRRYQWIAEPLWLRCHETDSSVSTLVTARGRLFAIVDEAPISLTGDHPLPDKWFLVARDAFNGVLLWKTPIRRWGWREWKSSWFDARPGDIPFNIHKRLVAAGDKVYVTLGYQAPVSELDARSGAILQTYADTERTGEILYLNGVLYLSVLDGKQVRVKAVAAASGKCLWTSAKAYRGSTVDYVKWKEMHGGIKAPDLDPSLNLSVDGQTVALLDGDRLAALNARSGREKWSSAFPSAEADRNAGGIAAKDNLWIGTLIVRDGVVLHSSPHCLAAFDADSGKLLWSQPKKYIGHLWYEWKDVFVIDRLVWTWSAELEQATLEGDSKQRQRTLFPKSINGYDLRTGELKQATPLGAIFKANHHHRCYRNKATEKFILTSRRGSEFVDLAGGPHTVDNWVRGTCHVGMMPANGLQYVPPHPCACYIDEKLNGFNALAPAGSQPAFVAAPPLLERGPAFGKAAGPAAGPDDWPVFRHDNLRSGAAATTLPDGLAALWRVRVGRSVSPPNVVHGRVYASLVDEHHVVCLDARNGRKLWEFAAGARVDSPPTYADGRLLFGSTDGWVTCLRATDGQLAWRFRAAPAERQIGAFNQLESAWPVHGSVLVQNGLVSFAAGRSSHLDGGLFLYGLDAVTGEVRHQTRLEGPRYTSANIEENNRLPMGFLPDILRGDGQKIYMRSTIFDAELKQTRGKSDLQVRTGYLDNTYFKRTPYTFDGEYANLLAHDRDSVYYVRMFDSLRGLDPTVYFTPGKKGYLLFAKNLAGKRSAWSERVPVRIQALLLSAGRLVTAGPPDVVDPHDPLGAFEARLGGLLHMLDAKTGEKVVELRLDSPPVYNGLAAAAGRVYLADQDGSITCFGKP